MIELIFGAFIALIAGFFAYKDFKFLSELRDLEKRIKARRWNDELRRERERKNGTNNY